MQSLLEVAGAEVILVGDFDSRSQVNVAFSDLKLYYVHQGSVLELNYVKFYRFLLNYIELKKGDMNQICCRYDAKKNEDVTVKLSGILYGTSCFLTP